MQPINLRIYPNNMSWEPNNQQEVLNGPAPGQASPSPSRLRDRDFERFQALIYEASTKGMEMRIVMSILEIAGQNYASEGGVPFTHLEPMGPGMSAAKPYMYDGARPEQIDRRVRDDLERHIIPSGKTFRPAAPNFFVEGKSKSGRADVNKLQACHYGAIGARAMHSLQNYGRESKIYDWKAYSFSTTYHDGTLKFYAIHPTAPKARGGNPEYHMTQLRSFNITDSRKTLREAVKSYRNLRDLAAEYRDTFIEHANTVAQRNVNTHTGPSPPQDPGVNDSQQWPVMTPDHDSNVRTDRSDLDGISISFLLLLAFIFWALRTYLM